MGKMPYFNSHAHVERDVSKHMTSEQKAISTHTLTWSVTQPPKTVIYSGTISTHTLTWSVTPGIEILFDTVQDFNSHAHVERDARLTRI